MRVAFDQHDPFESRIEADAVHDDARLVFGVARDDDALVDVPVVLHEDVPCYRGQDDPDHENDDTVVPLHEKRLIEPHVMVELRVTFPCQVTTEELDNGDDEHANTENDEQPTNDGEADQEALVGELHVVFFKRVLGHDFQSIESRYVKVHRCKTVHIL